MTNPPDRSGAHAELSPDRWAFVRAIVEEALTLQGEARTAFLEGSCGDDVALRDRVTQLTLACERAGKGWGFLEQPAGALAAPLLGSDTSPSADPTSLVDGPPAAFFAALADRYEVGAEIGRGGMATVYVAQDVRHQRRVALKVLDPRLGAMLGAERFLTEIRVTARLLQPNLVPLFDSGEAGGLLYYVMPLIEGATLRARLQREGRLPVQEAVGIVRIIAGALDYAHRQGVVHRDLKPENILLQDDQPLVADFGISLAVTNAADSRLTAIVKSLGTPHYMSPEQATPDAAVDARSDIYSLACVLYELLVGRPPFTADSVPAVIAKVLADRPAPIRTLRPDVPAHIEEAIDRALSKRPAARQATAREFADALVAPIAVSAAQRPHGVFWRDPARLLLGGAAIVTLVSVAWIASREPAAPPSRHVWAGLIDQSLGSDVTITPDGRALVYTGSTQAGRPLMMWSLDTESPARALAGTEGAGAPYVAPGGRRVGFSTRDGYRSITMDGEAATGSEASWRYGNGAWLGDSVMIVGGSPGLSKHYPGASTMALVTRVDSARGERIHDAPLVLPGRRAVVFTVRRLGGPVAITGQLAIASLAGGSTSPAPHGLLGISARRAVAFVQGWLVYIKEDGAGLQAVRLDVEGERVSGTPISVLDDEVGNLETASLADDGTLLYVRRPRSNSVLFVDSAGAVRRLVAPINGSEFMHPRFSPDGQRFAVGVTSTMTSASMPSTGRPSSGPPSDIWLYDMATRTPTRLTTTDSARHPTWTPDGRSIVFFKVGSRVLMMKPIDGGAAVTVSETKEAFAPNVAPDGRSVVYQHGRTSGPWTIWSASLIGEGPPRMIVDDPVSPYMPELSPDGRWLAYVSKATGSDEVYARPYPGPGKPMPISDSGGVEPAWSPHGDRIYYRTRGVVMEAVVSRPALDVTSRKQLFEDFDHRMPHRNYDVEPNGKGFLIVGHENPEAVVVNHWLTELRERLERAR